MNDVTVSTGLSRSTMTLGEIEIELHQGGQGPPLLFLHGGGGPIPDAPFLQRLAASFSVIAPTHPGYGQSNLPLWLDSIDDFAHVYLDLIRRLDLQNILLVGHSIGGWTAAEMATKTTERIGHIALVAPVGIKVGPIDRLEIPDIFAMPDDEVNRLRYAEPEKWRPDPAKLSEAELIVAARNRQTLALVTWEPYMHNPKLKHRLHCIDRPAIVVRGDADGLVSHDYAAAFAGLIPGGRLETMTGVGHLPHVEDPQGFVEVIERFAGGQR